MWQLMNCALNEIAAKSKENPINPISPYHLSAPAWATAILFCSLSSSHSEWWERSISKEWSQPSENQQILDKCVRQVVFAFVDLYCIVALRQVSHSVARIMASVARGKKIWSLSWCFQLEPWGLLGGTSLHLGYSWGPTSLVGRANTNHLLEMNHAAVNLSYLLSRNIILLVD